MKKFLSFILAAATVLTAFSQAASAEESIETDTQETAVTEEADTSEAQPEEEVIERATDYNAAEDFFTLVVLSEKYLNFGDNITVTISEDSECTDIVSTFGKEDIICSSDTVGTDTWLLIYIPRPDENGSYITISENSVSDAEGNGNKSDTEYISKICGISSTICSVKHSDLICKYMKGETVTYQSCYPADFYVNGSLAAEGTKSFDFEITESGSYSITIMVQGLTIYRDDFNTKTAKKEAIQAVSGEAGNVLGDIPLELVMFIASPLLIWFPPLAAASASAPLLAFAEMFTVIRDFFVVIFR